MYFFAIRWRGISHFTIILFFSLPLYPVPLFIFLSWFLIFLPVFSSAFLPCCSTQSIFLLRSPLICFYACISFIPMNFSFCSLIYFSIFIVHHLPINFLSPQPSFHPYLLKGNVSAVHFSGIPHCLLFLFSICTYPKYITQYITIWFYPPEPSSLNGCLADCQFRVWPQERRAIAREADGQRRRQKMLGNSSLNL